MSLTRRQILAATADYNDCLNITAKESPVDTSYVTGKIHSFDIVHYAGHADGLKSSRTAREELAFWSRWCGGDAIEAAAEALELTRLLDLEVRRLSAGQRRRLALARLGASPRSLWLLDEPLNGLDTAAVGMVERRSSISSPSELTVLMRPS